MSGLEKGRERKTKETVGAAERTFFLIGAVGDEIRRFEAGRLLFLRQTASVGSLVDSETVELPSLAQAAAVLTGEEVRWGVLPGNREDWIMADNGFSGRAWVLSRVVSLAVAATESAGPGGILYISYSSPINWRDGLRVGLGLPAYLHVKFVGESDGKVYYASWEREK